MTHTIDRTALALSEKRMLPEAGLCEVIDTSLSALGLDTFCVDLSFVSDREIRRINRAHRDKDKATDVLSFPSYEAKDGKLKIPRFEQGVSGLVLGSVVIAIGVAKKQAAVQKHTFFDEVARLIVHSVCHLAGYDHERSAAAEKKMFAQEDRILELRRHERELTQRKRGKRSRA
jgi:probable rRNA maturation factor